MKKNFLFFYKLLKPIRNKIIFLYFLTGVWSFLFTVKSYSLKLIFDALEAKEYPFIPMLYFVIAWMLLSCNTIIRSRINIYFTPMLKNFLTVNFVQKMLLYNDFYYQKNHSTKLLNGLKNIAEGMDEILYSFRHMFAHIVLIISSLFAMYKVDSFYSLIAISWVSLWAAVAYVFGKKGYNLSYSIYQAKSNQASYLGDLFDNISTVKTFNAVDYEKEKIKEIANKLSDSEIDRNKMFFKIFFMQNSFLFLSMGIFYTLINQYFKKQITLGDLIMIVELFHQIYYHIFDLVEEMAEITEMSGRVSEGMALIDRNEKFLPKSDKSFSMTDSTIRLSKLKYQYPDANENEYSFDLEDDIEIKAGSTVAVVGPSGGGKTTLFKLLLRLVEAESGNIFIDGKNICDYEIESVRKIFALIPQEVGLFSQSIRHNISYGSFNSSDDEIQKAAKNAEIDGVINDLSNKYETLLKKEVNLSGGQKQRLMIARGLLRNSKIFLFDESTSSLDAKTESDILDNIDEITKGCTRFIIAHRLNTIKKADLILVFDKGKLVEKGNHEELIANKKLYHHMMSLI